MGKQLAGRKIGTGFPEQFGQGLEAIQPEGQGGSCWAYYFITFEWLEYTGFLFILGFL